MTTLPPIGAQSLTNSHDALGGLKRIFRRARLEAVSRNSIAPRPRRRAARAEAAARARSLLSTREYRKRRRLFHAVASAGEAFERSGATIARAFESEWRFPPVFQLEFAVEGKGRATPIQLDHNAPRALGRGAAIVEPDVSCALHEWRPGQAVDLPSDSETRRVSRMQVGRTKSRASPVNRAIGAAREGGRATTAPTPTRCTGKRERPSTRGISTRAIQE